MPPSRNKPSLRLPAVLATALLPTLPTHASDPKPPQPLFPTHLLEYATGDHQHPVQPVRTASDWARRRHQILDAAISVLGPLPNHNRSPLTLEIITEEEVDAGDHIRRRISYLAQPGSRIPAFLLLPKPLPTPTHPARGALTLHQTHPLGYQVVAGLGPDPSDAYGVELARRGWVCIAPAYPQLAGFNPDPAALGYQSGVMMAIWDNIRALDLLDSLPFVKPRHYAAIGHSLGGHTSLFTAAFDPRLDAVVSNCGVDSFRDYMDGNVSGWTSSRYLPALRPIALQPERIPFDFHELIGTIAPRGCLLIAPTGDTNFRWWSVDSIAWAARPVYRLLGYPDRLQVEHPNCPHTFTPEMRQRAYAFMEDCLLTK